MLAAVQAHRNSITDPHLLLQSCFAARCLQDPPGSACPREYAQLQHLYRKQSSHRLYVCFARDTVACPVSGGDLKAEQP